MFKRNVSTLGAVATAGLLALAMIGPATAGAAAPASKDRPPATTTALPVPPGMVAIAGTLQPGFQTTLPATLTLTTQNHGMVIVTVTASTASAPGTKIVRRFNGTSALDEFSPSDNLEAVGTLNGQTMAAQAVKDFTIQEAATRNVSRITAVSGDFTKLTATVLRDSVHQKINPFDEGATIYLNVSPTMSVTLSDGSTGMVKDYLAPGLKITSLGVFDRRSRTFTKVLHIRIDSPAVGETTELHGTLQPGFSALTPTRLSVLTPYRGLVTVSVPTTAKFYRRFNGTSSLYEFAAGDWLDMSAVWNGGASFTARSIRDDSIQVADTYSLDKITALSVVTPTGSLTPTATVSVTVLAPGSERKDNPFKVGQAIVLSAGQHTVVLLANGQRGTLNNLAVGQTISALGLVNRKTLTYTQVALIRIH